jgi:hypothetical protein
VAQPLATVAQPPLPPFFLLLSPPFSPSPPPKTHLFLKKKDEKSVTPPLIMVLFLLLSPAWEEILSLTTGRLTTPEPLKIMRDLAMRSAPVKKKEKPNGYSQASEGGR